MIKVIRDLFWMNLLQYFRQPETIFWALVFPMILAWLLGVTFDQKQIQVLDIGVIQNQTLISRNGKLLQNSAGVPDNLKQKYVINYHYYPSMAQALIAIRKGKISLIVDPGDPDLIHFDPSNSGARHDYLLMQAQLQPAPTPTPIEFIEQPGMRYIDFLLPGLIAMNLMNACLWDIGSGLIEVRMKRYLRRLMVTPMPRWIFLSGNLLTRLCISTIELIFLLTLGVFYFKIQLHASLFTFVYLFIAGFFAFTGVGTLIGSRTDKIVVGTGLINIFTMPMMLLSGIFFSYERFPAAIIPFIQCLPLTVLVDSFRKILIESGGFQDIILPSVALWLIGTVCYGIGLKIFRWY